MIRTTKMNDSDVNTWSDSTDSFDFQNVLMPVLQTALPFDSRSLEDIILSISDFFKFRVVLGNKNTQRALCLTTGLAVAGTLIGRHYGGKMGAVVGGAVGGACGVGVLVVSMREAWNDIKSQLSELFEIVYDYLANLGMEDYTQAAVFITQHMINKKELGQIILQIVSSTIGKQVLSTLTAA